jgi:SAM-dependent methyltransferase
VLDVGCGAGAFAARLAQWNEQVDALDRCAEMIEEARRRTRDNVNCVLADVLAGTLPGRDYDAIFSISALHHMPLQDALPVLGAALRPGGSLGLSPCMDRTCAGNCLSRSSRQSDIACLARCSSRRGCWEAIAGRRTPVEIGTAKTRRASPASNMADVLKPCQAARVDRLLQEHSR